MAEGGMEIDVSDHGDREKEDIREDDINTGPIFKDEIEVDEDECGNIYGSRPVSIDERLVQARFRLVKTEANDF